MPEEVNSVSKEENKVLNTSVKELQPLNTLTDLELYARYLNSIGNLEPELISELSKRGFLIDNREELSGPAPSKIEIPAKVYIHKKDPLTGSRTPHIDVESPILSEIIKPKEGTYAGGKEGGLFIGLKKEMLTRLEKVLSRLSNTLSEK